MRRIAGFLLAVVVAGCDASNPVAPVGPLDPAPSGEPVTISLVITINQLIAGGESTLIEASVANTNTGEAPAGGSPLTLSTDLGNFGLDETGSPLQLVEKALVQGRTEVEFFPGTESGNAQILAKFGETIVQLTVKIVEPGDLPKADFTFESNGLEVIFSDTSTNTPTRWTWTFGDGGTSTEQNPVHTYSVAGTYRVKLEVSNPAGPSDKSQFVDVDSALEADFEATTGSELTVIFADKSEGDPTSWSWSFGDGNTSDEQNPIHTYSAAGEYIVRLIVSAGSQTATVSKFVTAGSEISKPEADFDATPGSGLAVIFTDTSKNDPTSWSWTFGDGATSTQQSPTHTYAAAGQYTVSLEATNPAGSNQISKFVDVGSELLAPTAGFSTSVSDLTVIFTDTSTGDPTSWSWDFGDGGTSTAQNPSHTYAASGDYLVKLVATNSVGSDDTSQFVTVDSGAVVPGAAFTFSIGANGLTVSFTDQSTNEPTSWSWDFGDGGTSTAQNPSHTYASAAEYLVTLTASNDKGSASTSQFVSLQTPLVANFSFEQSQLNGIFTDMSTGNPTGWAWEFGDGGTSTAQSPTHTYAALGDYTVKLTVTNSTGSSAVTKVITIAPF